MANETTEDSPLSLEYIADFWRNWLAKGAKDVECDPIVVGTLRAIENLETVTAERDELRRSFDDAARLLADANQQINDIRRRLAEAPVYRMFKSEAGDVFVWGDEAWRGGTRVRIVRDDQPQQETVK